MRARLKASAGYIWPADRKLGMPELNHIFIYDLKRTFSANDELFLKTKLLL